jgi:hypothetical protein
MSNYIVICWCFVHIVSCTIQYVGMWALMMFFCVSNVTLFIYFCILLVLRQGLLFPSGTGIWTQGFTHTLYHLSQFASPHIIYYLGNLFTFYSEFVRLLYTVYEYLQCLWTYIVNLVFQIRFLKISKLFSFHSKIFPFQECFHVQSLKIKMKRTKPFIVISF